MIPSETVPCETCGTPTPFTGTRRCNNCWEVERRLPDYMKSPKGWDFVRQHIPKLDDWADGHPDAWDYDAVLRENERHRRVVRHPRRWQWERASSR